MVLYFSATGNTKFIAEEIAARLGDEAMDLLERIKAGDYSEIRSEKPFVICAPAHVCEMPRFFAKFIDRVKLAGNENVYYVFTSGGYAGIAASLAKRQAKHKGMKYFGAAEFKMPRNYPVSRHYPLLSEEENKQRIEASYERIPAVVDRISRGEKLKYRHIFLFELIITLPFNPVWTGKMHKTTPFYATDKCIGCGKCEKLCPVNRITMQEGRPKWEGICAHCMSCLSGCPVEAIEYRDRTEGKYRYTFNKFGKEFRSK